MSSFKEEKATGHHTIAQWASQVTQAVRNLPALQETWIRSLGQEDPLEKEMATHSGILAAESHGQRSLVGCSPWGCRESDATEHACMCVAQKPSFTEQPASQPSHRETVSPPERVPLMWAARVRPCSAVAGLCFCASVA